MKNRQVFLAQLVAVLAILMSLAGALLWRLNSADPFASGAAFDALGWSLAATLTMAPLGVLIVTRRPGNRVGWLLLIGALGSANPMTFLLPTVQPTAVTYPLLLALWFDGWSWIPPIFALFLIPLYFPTGALPTPRWKWLPRLALAMWIVFATLTLFLSETAPLNAAWEPLPNPVGFIPLAWLAGPFMLLWFTGLLTLLGGSVASLFGRYQQAGSVERQQIKWLLLAGAQFVVVYGLAFVDSDVEESGNWASVLFLPSALAIPAAVAVAILRYRLYDIDVIIRKTLIYTVLSALLALVYFGMVVFLQTIFDSASGQQSPLAIVSSTLIIAALFAPLRRRVQAFIDRRFYRRTYDAQKTLEAFSQTARDEVDLAQLTSALLRTIEETMEPAHVSVWIRDRERS